MDSKYDIKNINLLLNHETDLLADRHIGIQEADLPAMLEKIGVKSLDELINKTIPSKIRLKEPLALAAPMTEREFAEHIAGLASLNKIYTSYIGMGWYDTITPAVIQRNVFENPAWYTSYTPYQTEVSQGRLEALLNFQTVISDLTAMPLANCSLLDEATAAAEAATMMYGLRSRDQQKKGHQCIVCGRKHFPTESGSHPDTRHSARNENTGRQLQRTGIYSRNLCLHYPISECQRQRGRLSRVCRKSTCSQL